jgi:hypothetical protein
MSRASPVKLRTYLRKRNLERQGSGHDWVFCGRVYHFSGLLENTGCEPLVLYGVASKLLAIPLLAAVAFVIFAPAIAQDETYHSFADQRTLAGIPNFWNVISNLPFAVVGFLGLRKARDTAERILFAGVLLTAFGSAGYHWAPNDARLVWDRLPMTVVFMALVSILIGRRFLFPLLAFGIASILWWIATGDLRLYAVAQFGAVFVAVFAMFFSASARRLWPVLMLYALAKLAEHFDQAIYSALPLSGHTVKHLLAAAASYAILRWSLRECETS